MSADTLAAPVVRIQDVTLRYGETLALASLSLDLPANRMVGLIGPDGVGKSSLMSLLTGARAMQKGRIEVLGGTPEQQRIFYTARYHCLLAPCLFNDVDGKYRGHDGKVHSAKHDVYTVFSLWDTFRTLHPLLTIIEPERSEDFIRAFLDIYDQAGRLPVWELWGNETDCMIGYHGVSVIADAYLKGFRGFDADKALRAMVASAMRDEPGLMAYRAQGYISSEDQSESVSRTLEYAYDDWCIARMAQAMGKDSLASVFFGRSANWRNLYDPNTGFFRARRNGGFREPFDPYEVNFDFTEANAWHYSAFVPQDVEGLDRLLKATGHGGLEQHLDDLFSAKERTTGRDQSDITGLIGQYAHGNEPSHAMAWMYNRVGRQDKAKNMVHRILTGLYADAPDGLSGNEDCGQMSAWYVMGALGLYPIAPGDGRMELLSPIFHGYRIHLANGKQVQVRCTGELNGPRFIRSATVNGERKRLTNIPYSALMGGLDLRLELTGMWRPLEQVAGDNQEAVRVPLSASGIGTVARKLAGTAMEPPAAPVITAAAQAFKEPMEVVISTLDQGRAIVYTTDGAAPTEKGLRYQGPFTIDHDITIKAATVGQNGLGPVVTARFVQVDPARSITVESKWSPQYAAGGETALIDGIRGPRDWRTGDWQGYYGTDLLATVDLGSVKMLKRLGLGVLQDERSWIWFPAEVQFAWSMNGINWSSATVDNTTPRNEQGTLLKDMMTEVLDKRARYVKVIARNAGPCPAWHPGHGDPSHLFADEILIETE